VPVGEAGELWVRPRRPFVIFNGYFDDPVATANAFSGEWYKTGDLLRKDAGENYFFVDRKKDAVRYKGRNISTWEVELVARRHPAIADCAAFGVPSEELESEDEIKLNVILEPGAGASEAEIAQFINDNAPYFFVPRYIEFVTELPYTPNQKVQKYKLREAGLTPATWDAKKAGFRATR
jgi:carnitine-CoA ligase